MQDKWTEEMVIQRFREAIMVVRRLPNVRPQGYFSLWPEIKYRPNEMIFMDDKPKKYLPNPEEISHMNETCSWLRFVNNNNCKLIWMRAESLSWKTICCYFSINRSAANKRYKKALSAIVKRLH